MMTSISGSLPSVLYERKLSDFLPRSGGTELVGLAKRIERTPEVKAEIAQREAAGAARLKEMGDRARAYANNDVAYFGPEMVAFQQASHPSTTAPTPPVTPASQAKPQQERIIFPNISSLTPELATAVYGHVKYMMERYGTEGKSLVAMNGEIATESVEVYQSWLAEKAGIVV